MKLKARCIGSAGLLPEVLRWRINQEANRLILGNRPAAPARPERSFSHHG
jgi:hypothetical protein